MRKSCLALIIFLFTLPLYGCVGEVDLTPPQESDTLAKIPSYDEFMRNRKECKALSEKFCPFPLARYCTIDAYEKRAIFIKNCMYERGWKDPYNMFSYYK